MWSKTVSSAGTSNMGLISQGRSAESQDKSGKKLHSFHGSNDIGETHAKFFVDDHNFPTRYQFVIDQNLKRLAHELGQLNNRSLA
jgi:hypothetical protein